MKHSRDVAEFAFVWLQKVGETPGSLLANAEQLLGQAGDTLTRESPSSLTKTHHSAMTQLDKLKQESRSLNQLKRAHERLQGHQAQVSRANAELESLNSNKNTRSKLQHADVSKIDHLLTWTMWQSGSYDSASMVQSLVLGSIYVEKCERKWSMAYLNFGLWFSYTNYCTHKISADGYLDVELCVSLMIECLVLLFDRRCKLN